MFRLASRRPTSAGALLEEMLFSMRALPQLSRIEAQLMPFGGPVDNPLRDQGFKLYNPPIMLLDLHKNNSEHHPPGASAGMRVDRWNDRFFEPCAKLIYLSYANHVDGEINDQYRSRAGALRFLKNIILLPGCGQFVAGASFVLRQPGSDELIAAVLTSEVSPGVGHTTQICVLPGYQGHGLGRMLMQTSAEALRAMKFREPHPHRDRAKSFRRPALRKSSLQHHSQLHRRRLAKVAAVRRGGSERSCSVV